MKKKTKTYFLLRQNNTAIPVDRFRNKHPEKMRTVEMKLMEEISLLTTNISQISTHPKPFILAGTLYY